MKPPPEFENEPPFITLTYYDEDEDTTKTYYVRPTIANPIYMGIQKKQWKNQWLMDAYNLQTRRFKTFVLKNCTFH